MPVLVRQCPPPRRGPPEGWAAQTKIACFGSSRPLLGLIPIDSWFAVRAVASIRFAGVPALVWHTAYPPNGRMLELGGAGLSRLFVLRRRWHERESQPTRSLARHAPRSVCVDSGMAPSCSVRSTTASSSRHQSSLVRTANHISDESIVLVLETSRGGRRSGRRRRTSRSARTTPTITILDLSRHLVR